MLLAKTQNMGIESYDTLSFNAILIAMLLAAGSCAAQGHCLILGSDLFLAEDLPMTRDLNFTGNLKDILESYRY
ncbi:MAG: hypothetical protein CG443_450, partial [Methanosaeta sp. ASP1-1]